MITKRTLSIKLIVLSAIVFTLMFCGSCSCKNGAKEAKNKITLSPIIEKALFDKSSIFYANFSTFPLQRKLLPIGVFDSGTGGLTVLEILLKNDMFDNITGKLGPDGIADLEGENFTYVADMANMPYGNYAAVGKEEFFKELVVKDALFLLGDKYYLNNIDAEAKGKKEASKIIIVACNTASAYGLNDIETLLQESAIGVKVIGVINAGVDALFEGLNSSKKEIKCAVGVLATQGTILSGAYQNLIIEKAKQQKMPCTINVVNRAGIGFAESVDNEKDYVDSHATAVRQNYKGPKLGKQDGDIDSSLLSVYNFDYSKNGILLEKLNNKIVNIQLNSSINYARFHLVSLIDNYRKSGANLPLERIILACTHYPFLIETLNKVIAELRLYNVKGVYPYRNLLSNDLQFVNPAIYTALECYKILRQENILALRTADSKVDSYISIPSYGLDNSKVDIDGNLKYEFKYGRDYGTEEQSTVFVPFSRRYIDTLILDRVGSLLPYSYKKIIKNLN